MFEYRIQIEPYNGGINLNPLPPINDVLERIKTFLKKEFEKMEIPEFSKSLDNKVLMNCKLTFFDSTFSVYVFDGIVAGNLKIKYADIMMDETLQKALHELFEGYITERNSLSADLLLPCYDYYKYRLVVELKEN